MLQRDPLNSTSLQHGSHDTALNDGAKNLGDAPSLSKAATRVMRFVAVKDLGNVPQACLAHVVR